MANTPPPVVPKLGPMKVWCAHSGVGRAKSYEMLAAKQLHGFKNGRTLLIDIERGLAYLRSLPPEQIRPRIRRSSTPSVPIAERAAPKRAQANLTPTRRMMTMSKPLPTDPQELGVLLRRAIKRTARRIHRPDSVLRLLLVAYFRSMCADDYNDDGAAVNAAAQA